MAERMNVNPTRMQLSLLRKKLKTAVRGHKLLRDKRDELMKEFLRTARESGRLRREVESALGGIYGAFSAAAAVMGPEAVGSALMMPKQETSVDVKKRNIMGVSVPDFLFEAFRMALHRLQASLMMQYEAFQRSCSCCWSSLQRKRRHGCLRTSWRRRGAE